MKGYILIQRPGDREIMIDYSDYFRKYSDAELIEDCEKQRKLGIVGVHQQALSLVGLRFVMKERNLDCPIIIEDNILVKFRDDEVA